MRSSFDTEQGSVSSVHWWYLAVYFSPVSFWLSFCKSWQDWKMPVLLHLFRISRRSIFQYLLFEPFVEFPHHSTLRNYDMGSNSTSGWRGWGHGCWWWDVGRRIGICTPGGGTRMGARGGGLISAPELEWYHRAASRPRGRKLVYGALFK